MLLEMLSWEDEVDSQPNITPAFWCTMNTSIIDKHGTRVPLPASIYVDYALTVATDCEHMELTLAALIKAISVIMGNPDTAVCQFPLVMDK